MPEVPRIDGRDGSTAKHEWLSADTPGALWDLFALRLSCAGKTGEVSRMEKSYGEGVAIRTGPESCAVVCEGGGEALTGVRAGRVLSREKERIGRGADALRVSGRPHLTCRYREASQDPARSIDPVHARKHLAREPGDPASACGGEYAGRIGKSEDPRR